MSRSGGPRAAVLLVLGLLLAAGCGGLPESGPVTTTKHQAEAPDRTLGYITPHGPLGGESQSQTVQGFLDAMRAYPVNTAVAREYLTSDYRTEWKPGLRTITYDSTSLPRGESGHLMVDLGSPNQLDALGHWRGPLAVGKRTLPFSLTRQQGQWRISRAPNALVVPQLWFLPRFSQVSLYFFDPSAAILVPEPVFLPRGDQLATNLVRGLLAGPGDGPLRSFFPHDLTPPLSVPVSSAGVANVVIGGDIATPSPDVVEKITAQLVWTLKQDPSIKDVGLSLGGRPVQLTGGRYQVSVEGSPEYNPIGFPTSERLYGIQSGKVVSGVTPATLGPVLGPLGVSSYGMRSLSVDLAGDRAAGVSGDGRSLLLGPLARDPLAAGPAGLVGVRHLLDDATDLLRPAWDYLGRLWLVDRTRSGARVFYIGPNGSGTLSVPGISGLDVRRFLVSNDGSRLVALVHGGAADRVVVSRILHDQDGVVTGVSPHSEVIATSAGSDRIQDLGWSSPTSILLLSRLTDTAQVRTISVDGAPIGSDGLNVTVRGVGARLVTSPSVGDAEFALVVTTLLKNGATDEGLVDLSGTDTNPILATSGLRTLSYVG